MVDAGEWTALDKMGNDQADNLAGRGAAMAQVCDEDAERAASWDHRALHIQRRLLAVISHRASLTRDQPARNVCFDQQLLRVVPPTLDDALLKAGHIVCQVGHKQRCLNCGQVWIPEDRKMILGQGTCRGTPFWACRGHDPEIPQLVPIRSNLVYGRALHMSHVLMYHKGLVFCLKCGCRTSSARVDGLAASCRMRPGTASAAYQLTRMKRGLHPRGSTYAFPTPRLAPPAAIAPFVQVWANDAQ
jgi:hypothetical protein